MGGDIAQGTLQKIRDGVITEGPVFLKVNNRHFGVQLVSIGYRTYYMSNAAGFSPAASG